MNPGGISKSKQPQKEDFLADMATGLNNRQLALDEPDASASKEIWAEYYGKLVNSELNEIEKYSDVTFEEEEFNTLVHDYIDACKLQLSAIEHIKNDDIFSPMWDSGYQERCKIIAKMYEDYGLEIRKSDYEEYARVGSAEETYEKMKAAYHSGDYQTSMSYCEKLGDYEDTQMYADLIKGRVLYGYFSTQDEINEHAKKLMKNMDFEDTKDVLVSNYIACGYLQGYWATSDGLHTFEITKKGGYITTIPVSPGGGGDRFDIEDGVLFNYYQKDPDNKTDEMKITPVSEKKIKIYSYQVKKTYELTKKK